MSVMKMMNRMLMRASGHDKEQSKGLAELHSNVRADEAFEKLSEVISPRMFAIRADIITYRASEEAMIMVRRKEDPVASEIIVIGPQTDYMSMTIKTGTDLVFETTPRDMSADQAEIMIDSVLRLSEHISDKKYEYGIGEKRRGEMMASFRAELSGYDMGGP